MPDPKTEIKALTKDMRSKLMAQSRKTKRRLEALTRQWGDQPSVKVTYRMTPKQMQFTIRIDGSDRAVQNWERVFKTGVKPHTISGDPLVFEVRGDTVFVRGSVNHPGYRARRDDDRIIEDHVRLVEKAIDEAYRG